jgi:plasmid maintenance system antidote protein VapI
MDESYNSIKFLIESGRITEFRQIYKHIKKKVLAAELKSSTRHLRRIEENPRVITIEEIHAFSEEFDVDMDLIYKIVKQQYLSKKKASPKKNKKTFMHN